MSNPRDGNGNITIWNVLAKHGPWAFWSLILLGGFYTFGLRPMSEREQLYAQILQTQAENTQSSIAQMSTAIGKIAQSREDQKRCIERLTATLDKLANANDALCELLKGFTEEVRAVHPEQSKKLDQILQKLDSE